jgi:hypothetical protein
MRNDVGMEWNRRAPLGAVVLAAVGSICFSTAAVAWGPAGHQLVADIAAERLTRHARKEVARLLKSDLNAAGQPSGARSLAAVSVWADEYRRTPAGTSTAPWHYDNRPICDSQPSTPSCPSDGACASHQLERQIAILADHSAAPRARNEALKFVVHLMGDVHQPLHEADNHDRGGNLVKVRFFDISQDEWGPLNLHGVWDTYLVDRLLAQTPGGARAIVRQEGQSTKHPDWESGSLADWIEESHRLGVSVTYAKLSTTQPCNQPTSNVLELGQDYFAATAPTVDVQLRKAGVRLAKVLNEALDR